MAVLVMSVLVQKEGLWACIFCTCTVFLSKGCYNQARFVEMSGNWFENAEKIFETFLLLLCSNFVKKKRLQLASIAQCASKYTDRKKSHGAFVLSDILFDTLMPFRRF